MVTKKPGVVFDIDGVLVKGTTALPHAQRTIERLQAADIPFVFLTNGGGLTEEAHTRKLANRLGVTLDSRQFIQSHTPYHDLVEKYKDQLVLVLGGTGDQVRNVAEEYGFRKVITSADVYLEDPTIHPFPEMTREKLVADARPWQKIKNLDKPIKETAIAAILVWSSPRDWCLDLQIILDLKLSAGGYLGTRSTMNGQADLPNKGYGQDDQPNLYFCNPDYTWATSAEFPRLAQGGFRAALVGLWNCETKCNGAKLGYDTCGKPTSLTFEYGEKALVAWANRERDEADLEEGEISGGEVRITRAYMVGDNPASDVKGANEFKSARGIRWHSILVETGVHQHGTQPKPEPWAIAANVKDAVQVALDDFNFDLLP